MDLGLSTASRAPALAEEVPFVDLGRQHAELADELRTAFDSVVEQSGFVLGEEVEGFEEEFGAFCSVADCVGTASGTAGLTLGLLAAGIGPGDEVIVPAHTYIASALGVLHAGATPVLCDVRADTGLIDTSSAAQLVNERTAAVMAVHLYGQVCNMNEVRELADRGGLLVVEDAAHAPGARFAGRRAGSFGDLAVFSFSPEMNLGALGDSGAVCTNDASIAERVRRLRNLGQRRTGEHVEVGFNERLDGVQAALLRVKLRYLDQKNAARRAWAGMYRAMLPRTLTVLWEEPHGDCVYHLFPIRVADRDRVLEGLRSRGVEAGVHYSPALHEQPPLAGYRIPRVGPEAAEEWAEEELSLPMFPELTAEEVSRVCEVLGSVIDEDAG